MRTQDQVLKGLTIGDRLPPAPAAAPAALFSPGPPRWHALRVAPLTEVRVEAWLEARGVEAFHPVLIRQVRQCGRLVRRERRYLPGYVFALFPGEAVPHAVTAHRFVYGAICRADGTWGALDPASLQAIMAMRRVDAALEAQRRAARARVRAALRVRAGERALFRAGPLAGQACEVVELRADGGAVVRLAMLGGLTDVATDAAELVPLRRVG